MNLPLRVVLADPIGGDSEVVRAAFRPFGIEVLAATPDTWLDCGASADAIIINLVQVTATNIDGLHRCKIIARLGIGVDSVDVEAATRRGIWVTNVPAYCIDEVAEHTLALILALQRRIGPAHADLLKGNWNQLAYRGIRQAANTTIGLVGFGQLGRAVAQRASSLGYRLLAYDPAASRIECLGVEFAPFEELLGVSDFVSVHVPLSEATRNLFDRAEFTKMKRGSYFINTSRGGLVNESALIKALDSGKLAGAALDAFVHEPLGQDSPLLNRRNVLLTPHIAFFSEEALVSLQEQAAAEVMRVLEGGIPLNPVNEPGRTTRSNHEV